MRTDPYNSFTGATSQDISGSVLLKPLSFYSTCILFYPMTLQGHWSTMEDFTTNPFHLVLISADLVEIAKFIPFHSIMLSSYLFFFYLSQCPVESSLLNQKTLSRGPTVLVSVSGSGVYPFLQWLLGFFCKSPHW